MWLIFLRYKIPKKTLYSLLYSEAVMIKVGECKMWGIQYKTTDECETVWRTLILFKTEEEAIRTCREMNIRANKFNMFRVCRITEVESANGFHKM